MLWKLVDVVVIIVAIGALLLLGPNVLGLSKWKERFARREQERAEARAKAEKGG